MHTTTARLALLAVMSLAVPAAWAGSFEVAPMRIELWASRPSTTITVSNTGTATAQYQITGFTWDQGEDGSNKLSPTSNLVIFPTVLEVAPGTSRTVRIETTGKPGAQQESYRVIVEELPPAAEPEGTGVALKVRTRMSIPVFVAPVKVSGEGEVTDVSLAAGELSLAVENRRTIFLMLSSVRVVGESETGEETLRWESKACWYLLAGATRRVRTALSPDACEKTARLRLVVDTDRGPVTATLPVTPDMCK